MLCYKISEIVIVVVVCFKIDNKTYNWHKKNINYNKYNSIGNFKLNTLDKSTFMYLHVEDDDDNDFNRKFINKVNELITHMHVYTYTYLCTHTRCDQKTSHYFKFFQKVFIYLSITSLSPSKLPPSHIIQFQSSKYFWNAHFDMANSSCYNFSFISSIVTNRFPFIGVFSFGKKKKSSWTKTG